MIDFGRELCGDLVTSARRQRRAVADTCARHLLTSHGLRSLLPDDTAYIGHYGGDPYQRAGAYHQGTIWSWLIGPFVSAHLRIYGDQSLARSFLQSLIHHLTDHGLGSISEIFDGDLPFTPLWMPGPGMGCRRVSAGLANDSGGRSDRGELNVDHQGLILSLS